MGNVSMHQTADPLVLADLFFCWECLTIWLGDTPTYDWKGWSGTRNFSTTYEQAIQNHIGHLHASKGGRGDGRKYVVYRDELTALLHSGPNTEMRERYRGIDNDTYFEFLVRLHRLGRACGWEAPDG